MRSFPRTACMMIGENKNYLMISIDKLAFKKLGTPVAVKCSIVLMRSELRGGFFRWRQSGWPGTGKTRGASDPVPR